MFAGGELLSRVDARTISGDAIAYNVVDETSRASTRSGGVLGYWVDQGTAATASQPKLARIEMKLRKVGALGYMTDELVSDAAALGGELQAMFTDELTFQVEDAIFEGTGAGSRSATPSRRASCQRGEGIRPERRDHQLHEPVEDVGAPAGALAEDGRRGSINVDCQPQLDFLTIPAGAGALEPRFVNYGPDGVLTIKGRPVVRWNTPRRSARSATSRWRTCGSTA
jgi:hypothetical protein